MFRLFSAQVLLIIGILLAAFLSFILFFSAGNQHEVVLTESGYQPLSLTIAVGDTVTFVTNLAEDHWPASNVHPAHTAYPDFDPRRPVPATVSWSFTFTESGTYKFHDHLNAQYEGVIVVGEETKIDTAACDQDKTVRCFEQLVEEVVAEGGIKAAFDVVVELSETEPLFRNDCHGYAHIIGEAAYDLYANGEDFSLSADTALCGYGFYHGFMETLLLTNGDVEEARSFCRYVDKQLSKLAAGASNACFHGTGHGAVDGSDPTAWGDVDALMEPGFILCEKIAKTELQSYLCHTGVFNAIDILSRDPKYDIEEVQQDPFATVCYHQPDERLEGCYTNMMPVVLTMYKNDVAATADYINEHMLRGETPSIEGYTTNEMVTLAVFAQYVRIHGSEEGYMERAIDLCRSQPADDQYACFEGLSYSHVKYGPPGKGYIKNLEFCAHPDLVDTEEDACYSYLLNRLRNYYGNEGAKQVCAMVPEEYSSKYCQYVSFI